MFVDEINVYKLEICSFDDILVHVLMNCKAELIVGLYVFVFWGGVGYND